MKHPEPAAWLSAHFIFTDGSWVEEVPYDPDLYFHGRNRVCCSFIHTWVGLVCTTHQLAGMNTLRIELTTSTGMITAVRTLVVSRKLGIKETRGRGIDSMFSLTA